MPHGERRILSPPGGFARSHAGFLFQNNVARNRSPSSKTPHRAPLTLHWTGALRWTRVPKPKQIAHLTRRDGRHCRREIALDLSPVTASSVAASRASTAAISFFFLAASGRTSFPCELCRGCPRNPGFTCWSGCHVDGVRPASTGTSEHGHPKTREKTLCGRAAGAAAVCTQQVTRRPGPRSTPIGPF